MLQTCGVVWTLTCPGQTLSISFGHCTSAGRMSPFALRRKHWTSKRMNRLSAAASLAFPIRLNMDPLNGLRLRPLFILLSTLGSFLKIDVTLYFISCACKMLSSSTATFHHLHNWRFLCYARSHFVCFCFVVKIYANGVCRFLRPVLLQFSVASLALQFSVASLALHLTI